MLNFLKWASFFVCLVAFFGALFSTTLSSFLLNFAGFLLNGWNFSRISSYQERMKNGTPTNS